MSGHVQEPHFRLHNKPEITQKNKILHSIGARIIFIQCQLYSSPSNKNEHDKGTQYHYYTLVHILTYGLPDDIHHNTMVEVLGRYTCQHIARGIEFPPYN